MAYQVNQYPTELEIAKDYRYTGLMTGIAGIFTSFFGLVLSSQLHLESSNALWLVPVAITLRWVGPLPIAAGLVLFGLERRTVIDYEKDIITRLWTLAGKALPWPAKTVIPFKTIDQIVIRQHQRPASPHLQKTMGADSAQHWVFTVENDVKPFVLIDTPSELEMRHFLDTLRSGADWPIEQE